MAKNVEKVRFLQHICLDTQHILQPRNGAFPSFWETIIMKKSKFGFKANVVRYKLSLIYKKL